MRPQRITALLGAVALLLLALGVARAADTVDVVIGGEMFTLELALDPAARSRGLMYRDHIDDDGGMLFVFPSSSVRYFWMKNCLVDMDILFLDDNGTVVLATEMFAEPLQRANESAALYQDRLPRYSSVLPAQLAIELAHGTAKRLGIVVGDRIALDIPPLIARAR